MKNHAQIKRIRIPVEWQAIVLADMGDRTIAFRWPQAWAARMATLGVLLVTTGACLMPAF